MPLKWKLENEWFSSEDIGIVKDKRNGNWKMNGFPQKILVLLKINRF